MFVDREDACFKLSEELRNYCSENCIVIGIPRGGAVIAECIAKRLQKPWDIIVPRKIGSPFNKEVAIGAVTQDGYVLLNEKVVENYNIPKEYIYGEVKNEINEIKRRLIDYKGSSNFPDVSDKTVILVDDGIATGFTIIAAVNSIKKHKASKIIVAVPVAPIEAIDMLKEYVDEIICIEIPNPFVSVGSSYMSFEQSTDEDIISLFRQSSSKKFV